MPTVTVFAGYRGDVSDTATAALLLDTLRAATGRPGLDEATVGVDPQTRHAMWDEIETLRAEGTTVLVTTHYIEEADVLCDRVAIMDHGRILALDTPHGLKQTVEADTLVTIQAIGDLEGFA